MRPEVEATCPRCLCQDVVESFGVYECEFCGLIFRSINIDKAGASLRETALKTIIYMIEDDETSSGGLCRPMPRPCPSLFEGIQ